MKYPIEVQNELFEKLISTARQTTWGRQYHYSELHNAEAFKQRVPLQTYEELKPYVDRLKKGEEDLLWPGEIQWFAKSSGTTSDRSKFIPVSREALESCHYKGGKDLLALYVHNNPKSKVYNGKSLVLGGSSQINELRQDSYYGDLSAIIINNLPFWVEFKRIPDRSIALMSEWEEKIEKMARATCTENVSSLAGVPSWTLVLLKRVLEITGRANIKEVWPNLELFMHGGVNFAPYEAQFRRLIQPDIQYYQNYNASEGFFGIQDRNDADDMLLMLDYGIYYEFIKAEDFDQEQPPTIGLSEVETGQNYELVISTNGGLWRYRLGDTVTFTSRFPFRIKVSGRTRHFINAFGEELIIDNAEKALASTCRELNCSIVDFTAGPVYMGDQARGAHQWLIEFEQEPESLSVFAERLDTALRQLNSDYDAKRTADLNLLAPIVQKVPAKTFHNWLKQRNKLGGQHKIPRLSNDRKFLDEILEYVPG